MKNPLSAKKIGLLGPFGYGNLGDAAIQQAMIQHIRRYCPEARIFGFSLNPEDTKQRHGIPSYAIIRRPSRLDTLLEKAPERVRYQTLFRWAVRILVKMPEEVAHIVRSFFVLKGFDMLIVSGGGQLDDYWGGTWGQPFTLFKWGLIARLRRAKYLFVSVGAEHVRAARSWSFIKRALSLASYRSYRDESSKSSVRAVGYDSSSDAVYPDLAFSLQAKQAPVPAKDDQAHLVVGIGPMAYFHPRSWPERNELRYKTYLKQLAPFVIWLTQTGHRVLFLASQSVHDCWAIHDLRQIMNSENEKISEGMILQPTIHTVDDLMEQLSMTDVVVASRLHGVILPYLLRKPVLALSYSEKINVLMDDLGQSEYCMDINHFEVDCLKGKFLSMVSNRESISRRINQRVNDYQCLLDEQYERLFAPVLHGD